MTEERIGRPPRLSVSQNLRVEYDRDHPEDSLDNAQNTHSFCQPKKFVVPRNCVRRALQVIDQVESPDSPGEVRVGALMAALQRFYKTFGMELESGKVVELAKQLGVPEEIGRENFKEVHVVWSSDCVFDAFHVVLGPLERLYFTLDMAENSNYASQLVSLIVFAAVMLSLVTWQLGTVEGISEVFCEGTKINECMPQPPKWMQKLEDVCVWIFTGEIFLRLISVGSARRNLLNQYFLVSLISGDLEVSEIHQTSFQRFCSFIISPSCVFDVLSVVPYWAEMIIFVNEQNQEISSLRMLYLARVTRVFKLTRALNADLGQLNEVHDLFRKVLFRASPAILMTVLLIATALFFFGTLIWYAERGDWVHKDDPRYVGLTDASSRGDGAWLRKSSDGLTDELSPFDSIPGAFWWTIVTITTVGYGDQVPVTYQGKLVGSFAMLYGTVILGLPLFVVGATFGQEYDRLMKESKRRQDALTIREGSRDQREAADKARDHWNTIKKVIEEQAALANVLQDHCPIIGIHLELAARWMENIRAATIDVLPSMSIDRIGVRVLTAVSDAEELIHPSCMANGTASNLETPVKLAPREVEQQASCRKIRHAWHKFALACCHLSHVPHGMIVRAFADPEHGMESVNSLQSEKNFKPRLSFSSIPRKGSKTLAEFAGSLHQKLTSASPAAAGALSESMCPWCGNIYMFDAKFCRKCGVARKPSKRRISDPTSAESASVSTESPGDPSPPTSPTALHRKMSGEADVILATVSDPCLPQSSSRNQADGGWGNNEEAACFQSETSALVTEEAELKKERASERDKQAL